MGLLECASVASKCRGYDYYNNKKVKNLVEMDSGIFTAKVVGTANAPYVVKIDVSHPRKSRCNCPHADGTRIICKHIIATYFTAFPKEATKFYQECLRAQEEAEQYEDDFYDDDFYEEELYTEEFRAKVQEYVWRMKDEELQRTLLELLFAGPEWQLENFVREHDIDDF